MQLIFNKNNIYTIDSFDENLQNDNDEIYSVLNILIRGTENQDIDIFAPFMKSNSIETIMIIDDNNKIIYSSIFKYNRITDCFKQIRIGYNEYCTILILRHKKEV